MATIETVADQRTLVRSTTTLSAFQNLHTGHFTDPVPAYAEMREVGHRYDAETEADYFRFLGLVTLACAQYGFTTMFPHVRRSMDCEWASPGHPHSQLALGVYISKLNVQSYPYKEELEERARATDEDLAPAAWGLRFDAENGKVCKPSKRQKNRMLREDVPRRMKEGRPICLPDKTIATTLSKIPFTGFDAGIISDEEFNKRVLPGAKEAVTGIIDNIEALMDVALQTG